MEHECPLDVLATVKQTYRRRLYIYFSYFSLSSEGLNIRDIRRAFIKR